MRKEKEDVSCNLCGLSCGLGTPGHPAHDMGGLINARVSGGYESTPGNGCGALDDCTSYSFSMCEFCLDWLFTQFKIPVNAASYTDSEIEVWRPAVVRVAQDDWRKMKDRFCAEAERRSKARSK